MQLKLTWGEPVILKIATEKGFIYSFPSFSRISSRSGTYAFGRLHGQKWEALYVGKVNNLRQRTEQQLKNLKLMLHLQEARAGRRVLLFEILETNQIIKSKKVFQYWNAR